MVQLDFILRVLLLFSAWPDDVDKDDLSWRTDGEYAPISFFINCNDVFWWATADSENLNPENVSVLEQALADCRAVGHARFAGLLFCARVRKMRPQGACYKHIDEALWPLFDACGPERPVDKTPFGNPRERPEKAAMLSP